MRVNSSAALVVISLYVAMPILNRTCSETHKPRSVDEQNISFRVTPSEGESILLEQIQFYEQLTLDELVNQFGGSYAVLSPLDGEKSRYRYNINTVVSWDNEKNRTVDVTSFLTEYDCKNLNSSNIIASRTVILQR